MWKKTCWGTNGSSTLDNSDRQYFSPSFFLLTELKIPLDLQLFGDTRARTRPLYVVFPLKNTPTPSGALLRKVRTRLRALSDPVPGNIFHLVSEITRTIKDWHSCPVLFYLNARVYKDWCMLIFQAIKAERIWMKFGTQVDNCLWNT